MARKDCELLPVKRQSSISTCKYRQQRKKAMFPNDTPNITDGTNNHVYSLTSMGSGDEISSVRREAAAPADQPARLTIKHQTSGTDIGTKYSSLVRFDRVVEDANGNQGTVECYMVLRWPPKVCTAATAQKSINELVAFLGIAGYKDKITNLEP